MSNYNNNNQKINVFGRSAILNSLLILVNLVAVFFIVKGFHKPIIESALLYKIVGISLLVLSLVLLFVLKGVFLFSYVARALVGGLFIVSGLIKANDPYGFAFKLEEYFEPNGLSYDFPFFEHFSPYALQLSIIICIAEIVLGVAVIVGGKIKLASWSLILMMIFFTWLTHYTTSCQDAQEAANLAAQKGEQVEPFTRQCVTDCGCFGDAMKGSVGRSLTAHESFWKDLVLFYFVLIIFLNQWRIKLNTARENWIMVFSSMLVVLFFSWIFTWMFPIFFTLFVLLGAFVFGNLNLGRLGKPWKMAIFTTIVSTLFAIYTSMYLPIKDYRPYKIGNNIPEQMSLAKPRISEFIFLYEEKATGKIIEFKADQWEIYSDTSKYKYHDRIETIIEEGVDAPIQDFMASINYNNLSETDKLIPYIDSVINADYAFFYEEKMVLQHAYGFDTIGVYEYDTLYYPDSVYTKIKTYTGLSDPNNPFVIEMNQYIFNQPAIFIMTIRDSSVIEPEQMVDFKNIYSKCQEQGIPFIVLSPLTQEQINAFKQKHDFNPLFLTFDGTEIKIIIRSHPGLVLLKNGTVTDKWPWRSIPDFESIYNDYIK